MAINVRLTDEADRVLTTLAEQQGISKNDAVNRAIIEQGARSAQREDVRRLAQKAVRNYGPLLDRLAQ
ncbi:CopG family transcriptional regulator [Luteipulveratus halotolerans]|uniref:CopG family transcriptional regulator n=1 Tax=Luteipulveratus halotolerans TaxID=1631356 RepID=A0A0L6CF51_9MICO|nr:CopG family transcriptional regulator [Luteipulveratus halotolerans]KNX36138.1 CopG family transcriptional regulator [Luteipulveratus halotolerans]